MTLESEAQDCNSCLDWHIHCKASCCRMFAVNWDKPKPRPGAKIAFFLEKCSEDMKFYYRLHGCTISMIANQITQVSLIFFHGDLVDNSLRIFINCEYLNKNLTCLGHPDKKPEVCKNLNFGSVDSGKYVITKNCRFKFKKLGISE